jgi:hypothetical protein
MTPVEDRLRATARALADVIPDDNPPPRRPAPRQDKVPPRLTPWRRARPWVIPIAAAVAVLAAIAASLAITHGWSSHHAAPHPPAHQGMPHPRSLKIPAPGLAQGVPPYYLTVNQHSWHGLIVSSTWNGRALAGVSLAKTWFPVTVGPGPNDRTFVVWARTSDLHGAGRFFLLRFDPGDDRITAVPLTVNIAAGHSVQMLAVSPDGKQLAVLSQGADTVLTVFNLSTGAGRNWFSSALASEQNGFLTWSANSQMVQYCMYDPTAKRMAYGLLDPSAAQTQLPARLVPVQGYVGGAIISADGTLVVSGTDSTENSDNGAWWLARFDASTGRPLGGKTALSGNADAPIGWASPDGNQLIMDIGGGKVRGLQVLGSHLDLRIGGQHPPGTGDGGTAW